mgnify:CR=1 FL=1
MHLLITNDDGITAPGILTLARVAAAAGHSVVVVAPGDPERVDIYAEANNLDGVLTFADPEYAALVTAYEADEVAARAAEADLDDAIDRDLDGGDDRGHAGEVSR